MLQDDDEEQYNRQFARYIKEEIEPDDLEDIYKEAHMNIRKDPSRKPVAKNPRNPRDGAKGKDGAFKNPGIYRTKINGRTFIGLTNSQKKDRVRQKLASMKKAAE